MPTDTAISCTIRPAATADVGAMVELLRMLFDIEDDFSFDERSHRRGLSLLLTDPERNLLLVAEADGKVCGMASVQMVISTAQGTPSGLVEDVVVAPGTRGCGVGRALMNGAVEWAVSRGATRVQLLADRDNEPALDFYNALGFSRTKLECLRIFPNG